MPVPRIEEIFQATVGLPPEARRAEVARLCAGDAALEARCLRLLEAADEATRAGALDGGGAALLETAPPGDDVLRRQVAAVAGIRIPEAIGHYHILSVLGEGGFGVVYGAERREPIRQRVAIKVIKPGMDSRAVIARFEQERQALAVMNHPNIAKILDAGVTDGALGSRPYFVMEHVQGEPITEYCDRHNLTLRQRLELFIPVCEAVQHAHHKGIIHRDLKPSNILVTVIDGGPVPIVIDFGIAKATAKGLTEATIFTEQGQLIGTPEYMSPEQAEGATDIDALTDVYSLGVVLYELLTGVLPFDPRSLRAAALREIQRIIREVDPPKPSTRLTALGGDEAAEAASRRRMNREALASELRRELDWIPLKALRKDRTRRYASTTALAADVRRYLEGKPLEAAPESRAYLVRKFVGRNRTQVAAASAVVLALMAGLGTAVWQASVASRERDEAERQRERADERAEAAERAEAGAIAARDAERQRAEELGQVSGFQSRMLSQIDTTIAGIDLMADIRERFVRALEAAGVPEGDRAARVHALRQELVRVNATDAAAAMIDRTVLGPAVPAIDDQFKDQPVVDAQLRQALANLYRELGLYDAAMPLQEAALATRRRVLGEEHPHTLTSIGAMGDLLRELGRLGEAEPFHREVLHQSRRVLGEDHPETLVAIGNMGSLRRSQGRLEEAEPYYHEALEKCRRILGEDHPNTLVSINNMGELLRDQGRLAEAEPYIREALERQQRVLGEAHPGTLISLGNVGTLLWFQGRFAEAEPYFLEVLESRRRLLGEEHPNTLLAINNVGALLLSQGRFAEAEPHVLEAMEVRRRVLGEDHPETLMSINNVGALLRFQGKLTEAEPYVLETLQRSRRVLGEDHVETLMSSNNFGVLLRDQGRLNEAEPYLREAVEKLRSLLGEHHPDTLISIGHMGGLLRDQGKLQDVVDLLTPAEPAARAAFADDNAPRLAAFLTTLGRARVGLGYDPERFALAEANLLEAHTILLEARGESHRDTIGCVQGLVDLYVAWDQAEPGSGYAESAALWRGRLPE